MSVDAVTPQSRLEMFVASAREFLNANVPLRAAASATARPPGKVSLFRASTTAEADAARGWQQTVFDAGFSWICGPVADGGRGLPRSYERAYYAVERQYSTPSRSALGVSLGMVAPTLDEFGSPIARGRWLRALYRGEAIGCQLFSEPGAGSDLASVSTRATPTEEGWRITGQKVWTSGAHFSDVGLLLARSSSNARYRNLTMFLVDMHAPGVEVRPLRQMTGGADFNEVFLDDVLVPDSYRLGEVDEGWTVALATLMHERGAIGGAGSGGRGLFRVDTLAEWIAERGRGEDPLVRQAYARVYCGLTAAKTMRTRAEISVRDGARPGPEMSLSKLALTSNLMALSDLVSVVLGPELVADTGGPGTFDWAEFVLGVPGMRLGGGTDEIQRDIIAKRLLGLTDG
jgi:alkylation response protein AidB-like acyl-CoA dehydrogenase